MSQTHVPPTRPSPSGQPPEEHGHEGGTGPSAKRPYLMLGLALAIDFVVMFALTYAAVNAFDEIFVNLNRFYMAVLMVSAMAVVMVAVMWKMLSKPRWNLAILSVAILLFAGTFVALRAEAGVGNTQFLKSMIPHHSIAIHTCENASITDQETLDLCDQIIQSQRQEIDQMKDILERLDG